ncbi:MAG: class I SAM-dependent methyltransferase [Rhodospirillaceae bacterium]|nr:class I SAM-dependent methyltransferase [Rhodospirillaceae bacterium]
MKIEITGPDFNQIIENFKQKPQELFLNDYARYVISLRRYKEAKGQLKFTDDHDSLFVDAIEHNVKGLESFGSVARTNRLIRPLYAIDRVFFKAHKLKALCVGPRTEMELFSMVGQGFRPENIKGLDLFSYSPWIEVGNMHKMPYADNSFDVLIAGWVLTYSDDPDQACREFLRVVGDRGIIAIGATVLDEKGRANEAQLGRTSKHYPGADQLLSVFGKHVRNVYVRHESEPGQEGRTIVIFDVNK